MKNLFWTSAQSWAAIVAQLLIIILLSRILSPSDFGFYAINLSIVHVLMLFAELGFGHFIVKEGTEDKALLRSGLGLVLIASISIAVGGVLLVLVADFFLPDLGIDTAFFSALTLIIVLFSVKSISYAALQREHQHKKATIAELLALSVNVILAYSFALYLQSYWALAIGYISYHTVTTIVCVLYYPIKPSFRDLLRPQAMEFARSYVFLRMLDMATRTLDNIILAFSMSTHAIGLYQRATNMRNLGHTFSHLPNQLIFYPKLADVASEPEALRVVFGRLLRGSLYYAIPASLIGFSLAPAWTTIVFGPAWGEAAPLIQVLAIAIPFQAVESSLDLIAKAKGLQKQIISYRVVFAGIYIAAIFLASFVSINFIAYTAASVFATSAIYSLLLSARMLETDVSNLIRFLAPYFVYFLILLGASHVALLVLEQHIGLALSGIFVGALATVFFFIPFIFRKNALL